MSLPIVVASVVLIVLVLWDAFEAMLLPRRVTRHFRFARLFYVHSWTPWAALARRMRPGKRRNAFLSVFGPLSILVLIGVWAVGLIVGFALLHWSLGSPLHTPGRAGRPGRLPLPQRRHLLHARLRRRDAGRPAGPVPGGGRGGPRLRLPRRGHQLPAGALPGVLAPRGRRSRCSTPAPARRRRPPSCCSGWPGAATRRARPVPGGVGALGGRGAGEPPLVPGAELLPLAARQPVVAGGPDRRSSTPRPW